MKSRTLRKQPFDIVVIGGGVVGTAIVRELSQYNLSLALLEAGPDVGIGTSRANTAILHTGFDSERNSLEEKLLRRGNERMLEYSREAGIPVERTGAILVAWDDKQFSKLPALREKAIANGVEVSENLSINELYNQEPNLAPGAMGAIKIPGESIICPFTPSLAFATQAIKNDVKFYFNHRVLSIEQTNEYIVIGCEENVINARWVINAAGLYSDQIDSLFGYNRFTITPRRGELIVFDKFSRTLIKHIILPVPTSQTKGVIISPTVFGNVLLGPTAEDLEEKNNTATSENGINALLKKGASLLPALLREEVTSTYAGLRAASENKDYQIFLNTEDHYICVGGIRSTGLSASMGIAEYVVELLKEGGFSLRKKETFETVSMPYLGEKGPRPYINPEKIAQNPAYGRIICHCEKVSQGEILDAFSSELPPKTLDGLIRRTRCLLGRCQGFYCLSNLVQIFSEHGAVSKQELLCQKFGPDETN